MILDNLYTSLCDYGNMDGRLARAFEWLKATDLKALEPKQTINVDGNRIKAMVQSYNTKKSEEGFFEAHRVYVDIQIVVSGREIIQWAPLARMGAVKTPYNYEKDIVYFEEPQIVVPACLEAGDFMVLFPTDGHKPQIAPATPAEVKKIVMKVAV